MNRIRAARQALGWTQADLANKSNVSPRTIHAVEKGRPCRQATKRRILNALGVPWETRDDYFQRARSVRRVRPADQARTAALLAFLRANQEDRPLAMHHAELVQGRQLASAAKAGIDRQYPLSRNGLR